MQELLTPANLAPLLRNTVFGVAENIHHFDEIDSTNLAAMQAATSGAEEGSVFVAETQLAGRGRSGNGWHSPLGTGIYVSVVLRPNLNPTDVLWMSLITGLAAHYGLETVLGVPPDLRWPNDIMLANKKLGGILTEVSADISHVRHVVVGVGLNVNQEVFPEEIQPLATSLRIETGLEWSRLGITAALLKSLDREYRALQAGMLLPVSNSIIKRFEARSSYARNAQVHVDEGGGFIGRTMGLDDRGFLLVETTTGVKTVLSGGVRKVTAGQS